MVNFTIISTVNGSMFIKDDRSYGSNIPDYFFDGEKLEATKKDKWFKISKTPTTVQKKGSDKQTNRRYELKAGYPISDLTPQIIAYDEFDSDDEIAGLYVFKYDTVEGILEDIEFEIEILAEEENFYVEKPKFPGTPLLMSELTSHPDLIDNKPCKIGSKELYEVTREYIKANIDSKYARVTSDYDFCLSVTKNIGIDPEPYYVTGGTKRKPTKELRYKRIRDVKAYETSPEGYSSYPTIQPISARNRKELDDKIQAFLEELIIDINKPYVECECCKGMGVILKEE
jgi:hypothetical protein|nr:MAG TPA: hypothetical protein [Caudoviricetes sp.]